MTSCASCQCWAPHPAPHAVVGECRRRSPTGITSRWPYTHPYDWCWEHEPRHELQRPHDHSWRTIHTDVGTYTYCTTCGVRE